MVPTSITEHKLLDGTNDVLVNIPTKGGVARSARTKSNPTKQGWCRLGQCQCVTFRLQARKQHNTPQSLPNPAVWQRLPADSVSPRNFDSGARESRKSMRQLLVFGLHRIM